MDSGSFILLCGNDLDKKIARDLPILKLNTVTKHLEFSQRVYNCVFKSTSFHICLHLAQVQRICIFSFIVSGLRFHYLFSAIYFRPQIRSLAGTFLVVSAAAACNNPFVMPNGKVSDQSLEKSKIK